MHSNLFLNLIKTEDTLLCSRKEFLLGRWLSMARNAGFNKKESDLFEWNAKMLITLWGNEKVAKQLHDYSYREWAGMLDNFYYERWKLFFDNITHKPSLKMGKQLDFYSWEKEWVKSKKTFLSETKGDPVTLCEKFLANEFEP